MNKLLCLSFLASVAMIPSAVKAAETLPAPVICIVEQATLDKSAAVQDLAKQMEKKRTEIQAEMKRYEDELKKQDKQLTEEQKKLSEPEFTKKRQAFEKRVREIQEKIEIRRAQMELAVEDAKKKVFEVFLKVTDEVRKEIGANVVVYKETIITADPALEKSTLVLEKLNKELPTVKVNFKSEAEVKKLLEEQSPSTAQSPAPAA